MSKMEFITLNDLIPIIPEIVKSIDYSQRAVLITPMEGLLD